MSALPKLTPEQFADEANYRFYRNQRELYGMKPDQLARSRLWGELQCADYEARYRAEQETQEHRPMPRCYSCGSANVLWGGRCVICTSEYEREQEAARRNP